MYLKMTLIRIPHRYSQPVKTWHRGLIADTGSVLRSIGAKCIVLILGTVILASCSSDEGEFHGGVSRGPHVCESGGFVIQFPDGWYIGEEVDDHVLWASGGRNGVAVAYKVYDSVVSLYQLLVEDSLTKDSIIRRDSSYREFFKNPSDDVRASDTNYIQMPFGEVSEVMQSEKPFGIGRREIWVHYHFVIGRREFRISATLSSDSTEVDLKTVRSIVASLLI